MPSTRQVSDSFNTDYSAVHKTKEDLFYVTYMAHSSDDCHVIYSDEARQLMTELLKLESARFVPRRARQKAPAV